MIDDARLNLQRSEKA